MKKILFMLILILIAGWAISCSRNLKEVYTKENRSCCRSIFLGWMDLHSNDYRKFGYPSKEEWEKDIRMLNTESLLPFLKNYLKRTPVDVIPLSNLSPKEGIIITFSNVYIDSVANSSTVDVTITDATSGKVRKKFSSYGTSFNLGGMGFGMMSFSGRLNNSMYAHAYNIYKELID